MRWRWSARSARRASCSCTSRSRPGATACAAPSARRRSTSARARAKVGPVSAAWLVSLLRNPEAQLQRATRAREIDRERVKQIVAGMRPMSPAQRTLANEQLLEWMPW